MPNLRVQIVRFVDECQPGVVECQFQDAAGRVHTLVDKVPIFTASNLWSDSEYPQPGMVECRILERIAGNGEGGLLRISTIEDSDGGSEFVVNEADVIL